MFDRDVYYDSVRSSLFGGHLTQEQVDGQNVILRVAEIFFNDRDPRFLAYELATTFHECATRMWPIEEYGKGEGHSYGEPDPETGETYYGRGFVQLTWKDNYARATDELSLQGVNDLVQNPSQALDTVIATRVLFRGMENGWFTAKQLSDYFNEDKDDAYNARAIINSDVSKNGSMIAGYHDKFLQALTDAYVERHPIPPPTPSIEETDIIVTRGTLNIIIRGQSQVNIIEE